MQISLLLLHYNNYFNRTIKKKETVQQYVNEDPNGSEIFANVNFVPGDGVETSVILGYGANPPGEFEYGCDYDYCVAFNAQTQAIVSRWFVMHEERTRHGQHELRLRRDVIADNYDAVLESPCFVEKGWVRNTSNPLLYNSEGNFFNQIKKSEELLKDKTNTAWIVGYYQKGLAQKTFTETLPSDASQTVEASSLPFYDALNIGDHVATKTAAYGATSQIYFQTHPMMYTTHGYFNTWVNNDTGKIEYDTSYSVWAG